MNISIVNEKNTFTLLKRKMKVLALQLMFKKKVI